MATFEDDTGVMAIEKEARGKLKKIMIFNVWTKQWRIKLNKSKSTHRNFTNKNRYKYCHVTPSELEMKYLRMTTRRQTELNMLKWKIEKYI